MPDFLQHMFKDEHLKYFWHKKLIDTEIDVQLEQAIQFEQIK